MSKLKRIFTNLRVLIVVAAIIISLYAIAPNPFREGATIRSVEKDSAAFSAGIASPSPNEPPTYRERVLFLNGEGVKDSDDFYRIAGSIPANRTVQIKTSKNIYRISTRPLANVSGGVEEIGLSVYDAPTTNIRKGLELQGGIRVLMKPEAKIPSEDLALVIENMKQRLNVFGLSDVTVREASDLTGNQYVLVEIAGVNQEETKELLAKQGKFEAKISNRTVFRGGSDITFVCRSAECSGLDPNFGCKEVDDGWACGFRFSVSLTQEAAQRQANATKDLSISQDSGGTYLNESIELYLDDQLVDSLRIGAELKGKPVADVSISGVGKGSTQQDAISDALDGMKRLQTILITGSLPVKISIIKTDSVSPVVGERFTANALLLGLMAALAVGAILMVAYGKVQVAVPILLTSLVEIFIMLGVASVIGWNIDLAGVAGIIAAVGTGVNDQIIITDEALRSGVRKFYGGWKEKIKNAFFIIFGAYITLVVAMVPLLFAGAGLLRGFALTTIIGISVGVFITRPAYANILEILLEKE